MGLEEKADYCSDDILSILWCERGHMTGIIKLDRLHKYQTLIHARMNGKDVYGVYEGSYLRKQDRIADGEVVLEGIEGRT